MTARAPRHVRRPQSAVAGAAQTPWPAAIRLLFLSAMAAASWTAIFGGAATLIR